MIWVPARLLYHAGRDADLRQFLAENMLRSGLFPAKLPIEVTARHWAAIYMSCDAKVRHLAVCACASALALQGCYHVIWHVQVYLLAW